MCKSGRALAPTPLGRLMTSYLTLFFSKYVDVNFTANVEEQLDQVAGEDSSRRGGGRGRGGDGALSMVIWQLHCC